MTRMCCPLMCDSESTPGVLIVCADDGDKPWLSNALQSRKWTCKAAETMRGAFDAVGDVRPIFLVICEQKLPDGDWKDVLEWTRGLSCEPLVIVTSLHADDRLWSEVLNLGGYDVLMKPLDMDEFSRVMDMAWHHWSETAVAGKLL